MKNINKNENKMNQEECLNEMQITRYVLCRCSDKESQEIEDHIIKCPKCTREIASMVKDLPEIENEKIIEPEEEGIGIIKKTLLVVLKFINEKVEVLHNTGSALKPAMAVRGDRETDPLLSSGEDFKPILSKDFNEYCVSAFVKENVKENIDFFVRVTKVENETMVSDIKFCLKDEKRQRILKEATCDGFIFFKRLKPSEYSIKITQAENYIGTIVLDFRGS